MRPLALVTGLLTAATYAALVLMTKRIVSDVPVLTLSFWNYAIAAVAISPLLLDADRVLPTANELPAVLALGVVFTALSGYLYIWSLRHVTAQAIGILAYIEPVSAALMAWAFLGESLNWQIVVGGALVIAAGATVVFLEPEDAAAPGGGSPRITFVTQAFETSERAGGAGTPPDRNLALELVRVTEAAAMGAGRWIGRGDKNAADQAAVDAMRLMLDTVQMDGVVVIGEGEKDEAPMLFNGESVGPASARRWTSPSTRSRARGSPRSGSRTRSR